jgi:polyhydroxybutyrate depolymerase
MPALVRPVLRVSTIAALLVAAAALGPSHALAPSSALGSGCSSSQPGRSLALTLSSAGETRWVRVHVPSSRPGQRLPLVLAFGGAGATGGFMQQYSGLSRVADRARFIAVYPTAWGVHPFWSLNDSAPNGRQDVRFVSDLLDRLEDTLCVDARRVYATGVSNGGGFTARIGCELSERLAAIAPVAGGYKAIPDCAPERPISVLEIHGTSDGSVPYGGQPPDYRGSVPLYVAGWRARDRCQAASAREVLAPATVLVTWPHCADGTRVAQIKVYGGPHAWPGAWGASGFSAAQAVWDFFRATRLQ